MTKQIAFKDDDLTPRELALLKLIDSQAKEISELGDKLDQAMWRRAGRQMK